MTEPDPLIRIHLPPLSPAAPGPLYQQIVDGIKREVSEGRLRPGEPLPSFRALAETLFVSLITVKRAYEELEREGIIFRKQGLGTFVSENGATRNRELKRREAEDLMRRAVREAADADLSERDVLDLVRRLIREEKGGHAR